MVYISSAEAEYIPLSSSWKKTSVGYVSYGERLERKQLNLEIYVVLQLYFLTELLRVLWNRRNRCCP